jgi:hypothetical protein
VNELQLWNSSDCAAFFRCSRKHFMESIRPLPTFPRARYLPTKNGTGRALWNAADVRAWAVTALRPQRSCDVKIPPQGHPQGGGTLL